MLTLQLAVYEGLLAQRGVADAVTVGRKIVGHFLHSGLSLLPPGGYSGAAQSAYKKTPRNSS